MLLTTGSRVFNVRWSILFYFVTVLFLSESVTDATDYRDGEEYIKRIFEGGNVEKFEKDFLMFTAPFKFKPGGTKSPPNAANVILNFPLNIGKLGRSRYAKVFNRDYTNTKINIKTSYAPFKRSSTQQLPYDYTTGPCEEKLKKCLETTTVETTMETTTTTSVIHETLEPVDPSAHEDAGHLDQSCQYDFGDGGGPPFGPPGFFPPPRPFRPPSGLYRPPPGNFGPPPGPFGPPPMPFIPPPIGQFKADYEHQINVSGLPGPVIPLVPIPPNEAILRNGAVPPYEFLRNGAFPSNGGVPPNGGFLPNERFLRNFPPSRRFTPNEEFLPN